MTVNIPDNHNALLILRENLEKELIAYKRRLADSATNVQRKNLTQEISRIQSEISLVNKKIASFRNTKAERLNKKFRDRQKKLEEKGFQSFPEFAPAEERYQWALSLLGNAIALVKGKNKTNLSDEDLIEHLALSFSAAVNWDKALEAETEKAKSFYNGTLP